MVKVQFKNLKRSDLIQSFVAERLSEYSEKFPDLKSHKLISILSMENSPRQAGPDIFTAKLVIQGRKFKDMVLRKSRSNLYSAIAELLDALLERLNRATDKSRIKSRKQSRVVKRRQVAA